MAAKPSADFGALHAAMQRWVDQEFLAGVSLAVAIDDGPMHVHCTGAADRERAIPLTPEHIFRVFSNTKLVTSCAALLLLEEGRFEPGDAIERFIPALGNRRVLRAGARTLDDVVPAKKPITIAQLMSHSAGLTYGLFDPGTPIYRAYLERGINRWDTTLEQMTEALAPLPLIYEPGTSWTYSIATDVVARLVEVVSGMPLDRFFAERIFEPLAMRDTGFVVPAREQERLAQMYVGVDPLKPGKPGLQRGDRHLRPGAQLQPVARLSGGGGLVSTLGDTIRLLRALRPGPRSLLKPATLELMVQNQLPQGCWQRFPNTGELPGRAHGLAGGLVLAPSPFDHPQAEGELFWGGMAGTLWWISARHGYVAAVMTQRMFGYADPFAADLKRETYRAMLDSPGRTN